jgi:aspartate/methionine/tyrosine aminotransferase
MRIPRFDMEDWLNDNAAISHNLAESGCQDFNLRDYLAICQASLEDLGSLPLGNNDTRGSLELRTEILGCYEVPKLDQLLVANGTSEALFAFFNELLEPDDDVIVPFPAFQCLHEIPRAIGCQVRYLPLLESEDGRLDLERLEALTTTQTKLIVINNPHNPLGWTLTADELSRLGEIAKKNRAWLLFDEHYRFLPLTGDLPLVPSGYDICRPMHDLVCATGSMIKCFGTVGTRIGWLIADAEWIGRCRDYKDYLSHTIPSLTDHLALLGLRNRTRVLDFHKANIFANLALLRNFMVSNEQHFEFREPTGGVVCFPKLRKSQSSTEFCRGLVEKFGVSLLPGAGFSVEGYVRLNFGGDRVKFAEALERLGSYLDQRCTA